MGGGASKQEETRHEVAESPNPAPGILDVLRLYAVYAEQVQRHALYTGSRPLTGYAALSTNVRLR